jgi:hypothetical protein
VRRPHGLLPLLFQFADQQLLTGDRAFAIVDLLLRSIQIVEAESHRPSQSDFIFG